ncbi:MAG: hypothetical protein WC854_08165 [Bacteroidales bacterium]
MGLASEMKNLSEDILASFKQRIKENEELVIEVQKTLDGFRKDHQEMANILKTNAAALRVKLDKDEKNRLKEADILMKKITKEHKDMAAALRAGLDKDEKNRLKEFDILMKSINEKISEIFTFTHDMLAKSEVERLKEFAILMKSINEEISGIFTYTHDLLEKSEVERLKEFAILMKSINEEILRIFTYTHDLLAKGEVERLKEFNVVMKGIQNDVKNLKKAVAELLGDFAQDRGEASAAWKKMSDILAQLRKTAVTPLKQVVMKAEKKEVKMEIPVEAVKETTVEAVKENPVDVQPKVKPKTVVPMTLEEKVLDFINKHPKGARISEMEEPLGETRMKLGFIAKNLLNEGKVLKIENIYYPKTRHEG